LSLIALYIVLIWSKLKYASITWNDLTLKDSNKMENIQSKFANLCYSHFIQSGFSHNNGCFELFLTTLHFIQHITMSYFFLMFAWTKSSFLLWLLLASVYPLSKLETFQLLMRVMFHDLVLHQGISRLKIAFPNF
jgi:ABC-type phosphate/phosphonate transport system permease subunit